ncbi:MAG: FecR domain-containing protein [Spirochaetia bacterium]
MYKKFGILILLLISAAAVSAQAKPVGVLEYFENNREITVQDKDGFEYEHIRFGMDLKPGDIIITRNARAELRLSPNGSIIKVAENTRFSVDSLQGRDESSKNVFSLAAGKIRMVAARTVNSRYEVRTPTAVCGVRGTDFGLQVIPGARDAAAVLSGEIEFISSELKKSVILQAGQYADVFADTFEALTLPQDQIRDLFNQMSFEDLDPAAVPGTETEPPAPAEPEADEPAPREPDEDNETPPEPEAEPEEQPEPEAEEPETPAPSGPADVPADEPAPDTAPEPAETPEAGEKKPGILDPFFGFLQKHMGMEIGSVTIGTQTYAKAVLQPKITLGKLKIGIYLPIIYTSNMFDPDDWYKPAGNNEWNFGFGEENAGKTAITRIGDFIKDLTLKIKSVEWGEQRDKFYLKAGNLNNMTLGHGLLMYNYANDIDFPAVRQTGLNLGFDTGKWGMETAVNDLGNPEIFGLRFFFRPLPSFRRLAIGMSAVSDIDPAGVLPPDLYPEAVAADPIFLNLALDLDLPIIETDPLAIILFADGGGMLPYLRGSYTHAGGTVGSGFKFDTLLNLSPLGLNNIGTMAGVMGNILFIDYRLEHRYFTGTFIPTFYGNTYERFRGERALSLLSYLANPDSEEYQGSTMGIFGSAGASIFNIVYFEAGYFWPWEITDAGITRSDNDFLSASLALKEGILPKDITAKVSYERTHFAPTLLSREGFETAKLFDANTVLSGEIVYPLSSFLKLAAKITTTVLRDNDGNIQYDENGNIRWAPSFSIETRM